MPNKKPDIQNIIKNLSEVEINPPEEEKSLDPSQKINQAYNYLKNKYQFRFNTITTEFEYKKEGEDEFIFLDDFGYNEIFFDLRTNGIKIQDNELRSILFSINSKVFIGIKFDPFKEYILNLPRWNEGDPDYIQEFLEKIQLKDEENRQYLIFMFKKWFVGLVVALLDDKPDHYKVNQLAFVMVGKQGRRKSTFFRNLLPDEWREKYYYDSTFIFNNKDHELLLGTKVLINLDELSSFNKTDIDLIKSKITQPQIEVRPPYGRTSIRLKRRASFCGSINRKEFLRDETGNRRWFVVEIDNIEIDPAFDISRIYAQAYYLLKNKFVYWVDDKTIKVMEEQNEKFVSLSMEEQYIKATFRLPNDEDFNEPNKVLYITATDAADMLAADRPKLSINNSVVSNIGRALHRNGFENKPRRTDHGRGYYYAVVRISVPINSPIDSEDKREFTII